MGRLGYRIRLYSNFLIMGRENLNLKNDWQMETTRIKYLCTNIAE
jgi:hypothetical protein